MSKSKHQQIIECAIKEGYGFDFTSCTVSTPFGTNRPVKLYGKQKYPSMTISLDDGFERKNRSFLVHKFVAYILYGEDAFKNGVEVRHLDGNVLNLTKENIILGSRSENHLDKPEHVRKNAALKARQSQGRKFIMSRPDMEELVPIILSEYWDNFGDRVKAKPGTVLNIARKFNLTRPCVQSIVSGKNFKEIYQREKEKYFE